LKGITRQAAKNAVPGLWLFFSQSLILSFRFLNLKLEGEIASGTTITGWELCRIAIERVSLIGFDRIQTGSHQSHSVLANVEQMERLPTRGILRRNSYFPSDQCHGVVSSPLLKFAR
jgi:hypothetical protein